VDWLVERGGFFSAGGRELVSCELVEILMVDREHSHFCSAVVYRRFTIPRPGGMS
jgi:hypothetical protein